MAGFTTSPAAWVQHFHRLLTGEDGWPETRAAAAQEILLAEMSGELPLDAVLSPDRARARIVALTSDAGGREFIKAKAELEHAAAEIFADTGITVDVGDGMLASGGVDKLIDDLLSSLVLMLGVILLTMMVLLRSLRQTLIATCPTWSPWYSFSVARRDRSGSSDQQHRRSDRCGPGRRRHHPLHHALPRGTCAGRRRGRHPEDLPRGGTRDHLTSILLILGFGVLARQPDLDLLLWPAGLRHDSRSHHRRPLHPTGLATAL